MSVRQAGPVLKCGLNVRSVVAVRKVKASRQPSAVRHDRLHGHAVVAARTRTAYSTRSSRLEHSGPWYSCAAVLRLYLLV